MASSYRLLGPRLKLSPFLSDNITREYLAWLNNKKLMQYSRQRFHEHTCESCKSYLQSFVDSDNYFWNVSLRGNGLQVGTVTAYVDPISAVADVGLLIGCPGLGYGKEAFGVVLNYLFTGRELQKVSAGTLKANRAMSRIAHHWGMTLEGILRQQERFDDEYADVYLFGLLKSEWVTLEASVG